MRESIIIKIKDSYIRDKIYALSTAGINLTEIIYKFLKEYNIPEDKHIV